MSSSDSSCDCDLVRESSLHDRAQRIPYSITVFSLSVIVLRPCFWAVGFLSWPASNRGFYFKNALLMQPTRARVSLRKTIVVTSVFQLTYSKCSS